MSSPARTFRKLNIKLWGVIALSIVSILGLAGSGFYLLNNNLPQNSASAQSVGSLTLNPGEKSRFFLKYGNEGDELLEKGIVNIRIGRSMQPDPNSFYQLEEAETANLNVSQIIQNYDNITKYQINTNYVSPSNARLYNTSNLNFSAIVTYGANSANNLNAPSGVSEGQDIEIGGGGYVVFEATLDSNILSYPNPEANPPRNYIVGDTLDPLFQEGVLSFVSADNASNSEEALFKIIIGGSGTLEIDPNNIGAGWCNPDPQFIGTDADYCAFELVDGNDPILSTDIPILPAGSTRANIDTATGNSDSCSIVSSTDVTNPNGNSDPDQQYLKCNNVPTDTGTPGTQRANVTFPSNQTVSDKATIELVDPNAPIIIRPGNIADGGFCNPDSLLIGETVTYCAYPLEQGGEPLTDDKNLQLPNGNIVSSVEGTTGDSQPCTIAGYNTVHGTSVNFPNGEPQFLKCDSLPTDGNTIGLKDAVLTFPDSTTVNDKAQVSLSDQNTVAGCDSWTARANECRLYFIGQNNEPINWQPEERFNMRGSGVGFPGTQKADSQGGEGDVTIVFDEIKTSDDQYITDGSKCYFNIDRYATGDAFVFNEEAIAQDGKCSMTFDAGLQRANYFRVMVRAVDETKNETATAIDTLVLILGAKVE